MTGTDHYTGGEPVHFIVAGNVITIRMCRDSVDDCQRAANSLDAHAFIRICPQGLGVYQGRSPVYPAPGHHKATEALPDKVFPFNALDAAIVWASMQRGS